MRTPLTVYALLPPEEAAPEITSGHLEAHDAALAAVEQGRWSEAARIMDAFPENDGPAAFLRSFLSRHDHRVPPAWDGVIPLTTK
jgi:hypothetical protein